MSHEAVRGHLDIKCYSPLSGIEFEANNEYMLILHVHPFRYCSLVLSCAILLLPLSFLHCFLLLCVAESQDVRKSYRYGIKEGETEDNTEITLKKCSRCPSNRSVFL